MKWKQVKQGTSHLLRESVRTTHNRIVAGGFLVVCGYLFIRLFKLLAISIHGFSGGVLPLLVIAVAIWILWRDRESLATLQATDEDRWLGYSLMGGGIVLMPFCLATEWMLALASIVVLAGIACSCWGVRFFQQHLLSTILVAGAILPNKSPTLRVLWETLMPHKFLEKIMAWAGGLGLRLIGQSAQVMGDIITLPGPGGSVQVDYGCNGLNMAVEVAIAALIIGLFLKQTRLKIWLMILSGVALALVLNVPRVMLLAMSEAYWGDEAFGFWHGFWGGQIFSGIMFTIYYYIVMAIVKHKPVKPTVKST